MSACSSSSSSGTTLAATTTTNTPSSTNAPQKTLTGEQLFDHSFPGGNGRTCATCHVTQDNFTLTPEHVAAVWAKDPKDPLFAAIDADEPTAKTLTFEHLKKGLVRVWLTLPDNVDQLDVEGNVVTPPDRKIFVWRGVPSVADSVLTAPYQRDGRMATLQAQAQGAVDGHAGGGTISKAELDRIAEYEQTVFTSDRSRKIAKELASGVPFEKVTDVEATLVLSEQEARGKELYDKVCGKCHGGANQATIVDRELHALAFPALKSDGSGNVQYQVPATEPPSLVLAEQSNNEFINVGTAAEMYLAQLGATEHASFSKDAGFPSYRFRFYTDGTRTKVTADMPPLAPAFAPPPEDTSGDPGTDPNPGAGPDPNEGPGAAPPPPAGDAGTGGGGGGGPGFGIELDGDGNPLTGPNFVPQYFSTDPGRAVITGNPLDFEAFDVPTLRGISKTAPYFHNNTVDTLEEVISLYSDHLLSKFPSLTQPGEKELDLDGDIGPEETFTAQHKRDLLAYLKRL